MQPETFDPELAHPDDLFSRVVVERDLQLGGEAEVVRLAGRYPGGKGVARPSSADRPGRYGQP